MGVRLPAGTEIFIFATPVLGSTHPPLLSVLGYLSPWVKRLEREADDSPPSGAEVNILGYFTSTLHTRHRQCRASVQGQIYILSLPF